MKKRNVLIIIASLAALGMTAGCVPEGTDNTSSFEKSADIEANNNETDNNETDNNGTDNGVTDSSEKDNEDEVSTVKVETEETEKTADTAESEEMEEATEIFENEIKNSLKARKGNLVENVSFERKNDNEYEFAVINGLDKENNIVWSYETEKYMMAQLDSTEEIGIYKNRYYFVADGAVIALNLEDGSLLWKNDEFDGAGIAYGFGDDGTLYLCGYFGPDFYAVEREAVR